MNWIAILASIVISMVIGMVWYSRALFAPAWMRGLGITPAKMKAAKKSMTTSFVLAIVSAAVCNVVLQMLFAWTGVATMAQALTVGLVLWLGFIATTQVSTVAWEGRAWAVFWINTFGSLVTVLAVSAATFAIVY